MKSEFLSAALILSVLPTTLVAQEGATVSLKIDVVSWGDSISGLSFKSEKTEGEITARAFAYSEPVSYSGPQVLEIYRSSSSSTTDLDLGPGTPEDSEHESIPLPLTQPKRGEADPQTPLAKALAARREEEPTLVALVPLPTNSRRVTVLLAPAGAETFQGYVIDDDPTKLPFGKLRVHNLSPHPIAMKFSGGQEKKMNPRETFLVNVVQGQTIYQLSYLDGDEWKVQENNIMPVRPEEQTQFIVLRSKNQFFLSSDGASGGFLQSVALRREKPAPVPAN